MNKTHWWGRLRHEAERAWIIAEKDIRIYYAKPPVIMWGIALPFFMFLSWSVGRNRPAGALIGRSQRVSRVHVPGAHNRAPLHVRRCYRRPANRQRRRRRAKERLSCQPRI